MLGRLLVDDPANLPLFSLMAWGKLAARSSPMVLGVNLLGHQIRSFRRAFSVRMRQRNYSVLCTFLVRNSICRIKAISGEEMGTFLGVI